MLNPMLEKGRYSKYTFPCLMTILLVDDEINLVESGRAVLESLGYKVVVAYDGSEAVDVYFIHKGEIDLVITDVVMPCMSGVDAMMV